MADATTQPSPGHDRDSLAETEAGTLIGDTERSAPARPDGESPARIGRFTILRRVGAGAMGVVYAAYDERLDRKVAIKLLHRFDLSERLLREARGLARLSHPNVVQIYEVGEHQGGAFLAMEFVDGETLSAWLAGRERASWQARMAPVLEAGRGLAAAHQKGLVHRDFKPDNVMVDREGRVRVMDFGLVRSDQEVADTEVDERDAAADGPDMRGPGFAVERGLTRTGALMGTPAYMGPEQHEGAAADARSDQFAFCVTLWEAIYGERPYVGDNLAQLFMAVAKGERREPGRAGDVPGQIRAILERGLEPKPAARWPSMAELLAALEGDPSHRRRWSIAAVFGLAVVAGTVIGLRAQASLERERTAETCASAAATIDDSYGPERAAEVEGALLATQLEVAPELWTRVDGELRDYAGRWSAIHERACLDGAGDPSFAVRAELIHTCLAEARVDFEATVDQLAGADRQVALRARGIVGELPRLERCADERALALRPPPPRGITAELEPLRRRLADAQVEAHAGRHAASFAAGQALLREAEDLGWSPFVAELEFHVGVEQRQLGRLDEAEATLRQAFARAIEAGLDALALRVATELTRVVGYDQRRVAEGLQWGEYAAALLARLGLEHQLEHGLLLNEFATVRSESDIDDHRVARDYAEALAIVEARLGPSSPTAASIRYNLATLQLLRGEIDGARRNLERVLALREAALGPTHPSVAQTLRALASLLDDLGHSDEARALLVRALDICEAAFDPNHRSIAMTLALLGAIESNAGNHARAVPHLARALAIHREVYGEVHPRVAMDLANLGIIALQTGDDEEALAYFEQAADATEPGSPNYVRMLGQLGYVYTRLGRVAEGQRRLERALALSEERFGPEHRNTAAIARSLGNFAFDGGEYEQSITYFGRALAIYEGTSDKLEIGLTCFYLGSAQLELGRAAEAVSSLSRAVELERGGRPKNAETRLYLADALWEIGERERARAVAEEALGLTADAGDVEDIAAWLDEHAP